MITPISVNCPSTVQLHAAAIGNAFAWVLLLVRTVNRHCRVNIVLHDSFHLADAATLATFDNDIAMPHARSGAADDEPRGARHRRLLTDPGALHPIARVARRDLPSHATCAPSSSGCSFGSAATTGESNSEPSGAAVPALTQCYQVAQDVAGVYLMAQTLGSLQQEAGAGSSAAASDGAANVAVGDAPVDGAYDAFSKATMRAEKVAGDASELIVNLLQMRLYAAVGFVAARLQACGVDILGANCLTELSVCEA